MRLSHLSKPRRDELEFEPEMALRNEAWFLPAPGEWFKPASYEEFGVFTPVSPAIPLLALQTLVRSDVYMELMDNASHGKPPLTAAHLSLSILDRLWCLLVRHVQSPPGGGEQHFLEHHLRSVGWSLFFRGSKEAMLVHFFIADFLAMTLKAEDLPSGEGGEHDHMVGEPLQAYNSMVRPLERIWDRLGTWIS
mmetsp:Transcript_107831/g.299802  ORF Transcript_107831/g.299802 Transcript_107831/m.299802 type:complete len:193 (+) Transcript_107831:1-579(+)